MAVDAFDPGPDGSYPYWPRNADGTPDADRMPTGVHVQLDRRGNRTKVDLTPRHADGTPIVPPTIPPAP